MKDFSLKSDPSISIPSRHTISNAIFRPEARFCLQALKRVSAAIRAHRVATSPSWAPLTRYQPLATARVGGSSCISRRRLPLAEVALGDLLGARFSPRGRTTHVLRAAWVAEIWLVLHGHGTGRGHGAAGRALSLGYQPACALENGPYRSMRTSTVRVHFEGLDESGGEL